MQAPLQPDEVFAQLCHWWDLHLGFGLCYIFSSDQIGMHWLCGRVAEELKRQAAPAGALHGLVLQEQEDLGAFWQTLAQQTKRSLFWLNPPPRARQTWLVRLNEQRQRLIGAGHLYVLCLPAGEELESSALAPDLWSVRSFVYSAQGNAYWPISIELPIYLPPHNAPADDATATPSMQAWQRLYPAWLATPEAERKILSVDLGLQASADATKLHRFDLALDLARQSVEVAQFLAQREAPPESRRANVLAHAKCAFFPGQLDQSARASGRSASALPASAGFV
jgi:hypothetical protein